MAKKRSTRDPNPSEAYNHLAPRGPRDLGHTADGSRHSIPSSTYRSIEETIPRAQMRTQDEYKYNPRTNKLTRERYTDDVVHSAQHAMNSLRIPSVTNGYRQRYNERVSVDEQPAKNRMGLGAPPSPVPLSGKINQRRKRY